MVGMDARRYVDVDAHILVLELCIHQRVDETSARSATDANAGLKAARSDRYFVANAQLSWLAVNRTHFRVLDDLGRRVIQQGIGRECGKRDGIVRAGEMTEILYGYGSA